MPSLRFGAEHLVRSKVRIVESSEGPFGIGKFKELQFLEPSLEGGYAEPVATESYEVGTANDIGMVVRNRTAIGEQGARCDRGERARNSPADVAGDLSTLEDFDENERSQATAVIRQRRRLRRSSRCLQALSHSPLTSHDLGSSLARIHSPRPAFWNWNACREHLQSKFGDDAKSRGEVKSKS
jgi:hypothetical protein